MPATLREGKLMGTIYLTQKRQIYCMSGKFTSLHFLFVHIKFTLQMFDLFSISNRMYASVGTDIFPPSWLSLIFKPGWLSLDTLCCLKLWKLPRCRVIYAFCMELWLHTKCFRWRIDQRWWGEGRRALESRQSPDGDAQFNLNAYYLFSHIMLGQARGQFLFSEGFKSRYTVSLTLNTKWIPKALDPQRKIPSVFQDSGNGDCSWV